MYIHTHAYMYIGIQRHAQPAESSGFKVDSGSTPAQSRGPRVYEASWVLIAVYRSCREGVKIRNVKAREFSCPDSPVQIILGLSMPLGLGRVTNLHKSERFAADRAHIDVMRYHARTHTHTYGPVIL